MWKNLVLTTAGAGRPCTTAAPAPGSDYGGTPVRVQAPPALWGKGKETLISNPPLGASPGKSNHKSSPSRPGSMDFYAVIANTPLLLSLSCRLQSQRDTGTEVKKPAS